MNQIHERIERYGAKNLSAAELFAALLSGVSRQRHDPLLLACQLLERYSLQRLRRADYDELRHEAGLSPTQALRINVVCEPALRLAQTEVEERARITSVEDAIALLRPMMIHLDHEEFRVLALDRKNHVLANVQLYIGTVDSAELRMAEIFREAVIRKASRLIVCHNHPTGDAEPSQHDIQTTKRIVRAGGVLDIEVLDHLIIGNPAVVSLKERMPW